VNEPNELTPAARRARRRAALADVPAAAEAGAGEATPALADSQPDPNPLPPAGEGTARAGLTRRRPARVSRLGGKTIASYPLRNIGTIAGKELYTYFASPIAYLVIAAFLVMNGYLFSVILLGSRSASMVSSFSDMVIILLFLSPAITMRLLSEEQRTGTIELLLTSPLREVELVLGKWLASMAFFIVMLALTIPYPLFLLKFGSPDVGPIVGGYIGIILLEGVFLSIGLLMSSVTQNQIIALALSFGVLLVLWLLQGAGQSFGGGGASVALYIALAPHFDGFTSGNIQLKDLVYYVSLILIALFLTVRSIETRRWR
jgi:ABC-2 type transport system permease protein